MTERWANVRRLRDALRQAPLPSGPLSPAGAALARDAALDALNDDALARVAALGGAPFPTAALIAARTVFTAPLEWLAVLWGRGTPQITLKVATGEPSWGPTLAAAARDAELPLVITEAHEQAVHAALIVVMGGDETVRAVRAAAPARSRVLAHGHAVSIAVLTVDAPAAYAALAEDHAHHDTRGCLSPARVYTTLPLDRVVAGLTRAMATAEARWPRGALDPREGAALRTLAMLATARGSCSTAAGFLVAAAADHGPFGALPRAAQLVPVRSVDDIATAVSTLAPYLSTVATDCGRIGGVTADRWCRLGQMQHPPLIRPHDGEDWLRGTARWESDEL